MNSDSGPESIHFGKVPDDVADKYAASLNETGRIGTAGESAERMSAEQFYKQWAAPSPTSSSDPRRFTYHFAEAYAEHCTATLKAKLEETTALMLRIAGEDQEAINEVRKRADSALSSLQSKEREIEKLQGELDRETTAHFVTIDQRDSSAALVRKLAQGIEDIAQMNDKSPMRLAKTIAKALLSDPAVENILKT